MYKIVVFRDKFFNQDASLGTCIIYNNELKQVFKKDSLERGWRNNESNVSCIPVGVYDVVLEHSPKFNKDLWEIKGVNNRAECKFHAANYWKQLNGCIALGNNRKYIDDDLILDVTSSRSTMKLFHDALEGQTKAKLYVYDVPTLINQSI